nr:MAG TPA: hypothetical protein [Caudoviricetes sp.]
MKCNKNSDCYLKGAYKSSRYYRWTWTSRFHGRGKKCTERKVY